MMKQAAMLWSTMVAVSRHRRGFCTSISAETLLNKLINHEKMGVPCNAGTDSDKGFDLVSWQTWDVPSVG